MDFDLNWGKNMKNIISKLAAVLSIVVVFSLVTGSTKTLAYSDEDRAAYISEKGIADKNHNATGYAQKVEANGTEYADENKQGFDLSNQEVISRSTSYFGSTSGDKGVEIPDAIYNAYIDALMDEENTKGTGIKYSNGKGIALTQDSNLMYYWNINENNQITNLAGQAGSIESGRYFVGYSFKKEGDIESVGYHLDGYIVDYTKPETEDNTQNDEEVEDTPAPATPTVVTENVPEENTEEETNEEVITEEVINEEVNTDSNEENNENDQAEIEEPESEEPEITVNEVVEEQQIIIIPTYYENNDDDAEIELFQASEEEISEEIVEEVTEEVAEEVVDEVVDEVEEVEEIEEIEENLPAEEIEEEEFEMIDIEFDETPEGSVETDMLVATLPQTGTASVILFYFFGVAFIMLGGFVAFRAAKEEK